jgi:hypothetical protein
MFLQTILKGQTLEAVLCMGGSIFMYYPNTVNNSPCGGFQSVWIVLPEHFEFASIGFSYSITIYIESQQNTLIHVLLLTTNCTGIIHGYE